MLTIVAHEYIHNVEYSRDSNKLAIGNVTRKIVPITGRVRSFLLVFKKQNREEEETE